MQITRQADYAVRAIEYLARQDPNQLFATVTVAEETKIPRTFLAKIISQLSIAGLIKTVRGAHGGISLARDPHEISLLDVVTAIDGPIQINEAAGSSGYSSSGDSLDHPIWLEVQEAMLKRLRETKFK
jgi:Rrf2 family protein